MLKLSAAPSTFCIALSQSVHWHTQLLYWGTLYNFVFFGFKFRQWWSRAASRADRYINLNATIWLPLFWRTWTLALTSTCPHVLACDMGRHYIYCRASELTDLQVFGLVFPLISRKYRKTMASSETFLRIMPSTEVTVTDWAVLQLKWLHLFTSFVRTPKSPRYWWGISRLGWWSPNNTSHPASDWISATTRSRPYLHLLHLPSLTSS